MSIGQGLFVLHGAEIGGFPIRKILLPLPHWQALPRSHVMNQSMQFYAKKYIS
jgi:hypothetical protein